MEIMAIFIAAAAVAGAALCWTLRANAPGNLDERLAREAQRNGSALARLEKTMWANVDRQRYDVVFFDVVPTKRAQVLATLRKQLAGAERQVFYCNLSFQNSKERICVLKSSDRYDIVRLMGTDGTNYDLANEQIVKRLQQWDSQYGIVIEGADGDWVDVKFKTMPPDLRKFAEEVYSFCPDTVEQNAGTVEALIETMKAYRGVLLWWD